MWRRRWTRAVPEDSTVDVATGNIRFRSRRMASKESSSPAGAGGRGQYETLPGDAMEEELPPGGEDHPRPPRDLRETRWYLSIWIRLFFIWVDPLYWVGFRRPLDQSDLYAHPPETDSQMLLTRFNRLWKIEMEKKKRGGSANIPLILWKILWWRIILQGAILFVEMILLIYQSLILGNLSNYFAIPEPTDEETTNAYIDAFGISMIQIITSVIHQQAYLIGQKEGLMGRVIFQGAIYQKVLALSQTNIGKVSFGRIINMASNDVQKFDQLFWFIHYLWIAPIHLGVVTYLIYNLIGWPAFVATAFIILQIPLQFALGGLYAWLRFKAAKATDNRCRVMNEVISGIRVIKMYAWEYAFKRVVANLRRQEVILIFRGAVIRAFTLSFLLCSSSIMLFLMYTAFTITGGVLTNEIVFTPLSLLAQLRVSSIFLFMKCVMCMAEGMVAIIRIQGLLELGESDETEESLPLEDGEAVPLTKFDTLGYNMDSPPPGLIDEADATSFVKVQGLSASWTYEPDKLVLQDINFDVNEEFPLLAVVGPVGSGKSTILQCLMEELKPMEGTVEVKGRISYTSQTPWLFSGTLRDNVLFGLPYDPTWYNMVIEACAMDRDIASLIHGDLTLVGERGVTLSGGQKARVSLARAIYHKSDIYLLDDPLSAVDAPVAKHLFENVIRGLLRKKRVVLVTHQLQYAQEADRILAIKEGKMVAYGTHAELVAQGKDPTVLIEEEEKPVDEFAYESPEVEKPDSRASLRKRSRSRSRSRMSFTETDEDEAEAIQLLSPDEEDEMYQSLEDLRPLEEEETGIMLAEERTHGSVSLATYHDYFRAGGNYLVVFFVFFMLVVGQVSQILADWWLADWADCSSSELFANLTNTTAESRPTCDLDNGDRIQIYGEIVVGNLVISNIRIILVYALFMNASRVLHNKMFGAILRTPVLFFDTNPIGRILNRFSKDVGFLDDLLTHEFTEFWVFFLMFIGALFTAVAALWALVFPAIFMMVSFYFLRFYYVKTAREIKRLEAIARSPLYSHISTSLLGLSTIRVFHKERLCLEMFYEFQNRHTQGWFLYIVSLRWFNSRGNIITTLFLIVVMFASVPLRSIVNPGLIGLALVYTINLTKSLQFAVVCSAKVENTIISAERVLAYSKLEPEAPLETLPPQEKPPPKWPDKGKVVFDDVSFRYSRELPLVLKSLNFTVAPGEKIGIVGRTGAGKSSLIEVLFRMAEPFGVVGIDGINTKEIGLHDLRKKLSIIPQDPVLFSGTMRYNLDPFDEYQDDEIWDALEQVQLKPAVEALEGQLEGKVSEGGANFSVGQRQLLCLARALLKNNKILVLDEATANVDMTTDQIIQEAIRNQFAHCTMLTIAHRLNTVMDSDRILVMSMGRILEFNTPYALLQDPRTHLKRMVDHTGASASRKLHQMAFEAHQRKEGH